MAQHETVLSLQSLTPSTRPKGLPQAVAKNVASDIYTPRSSSEAIVRELASSDVHSRPYYAEAGESNTALVVAVSSIEADEATADGTAKASQRPNISATYKSDMTAVNDEPAPASVFDQAKNLRDRLVHHDWSDGSRTLWDHENAAIRKWHDEINAHLMFAGLFSAVVTAFIVPFYVYLQPQTSTPSTADVLIYLSAQLSAFVVSSNYLNSTQPPYLPALDKSLNKPPRPTVVVNALWLSSLICTLAAATISISVKQWLNRYTASVNNGYPSVCIWLHRRQNRETWGVSPIISSIPILLQVAVALFLVGMAILCWTLNTVVGCVVWSLTAALLLFVIGTVLMPMVAPGCPYKSPQAWLFVNLSAFFRGLIKHEQPELHSWAKYDRWSEMDQIKLLTAVDKTLGDDAVLKALLGPYLRSEPLHKACTDLQTIMKDLNLPRPHNERDVAALTRLARWGPFISDVFARIGKEGTDDNVEAEGFIGDIINRMPAASHKGAATPLEAPIEGTYQIRRQPAPMSRDQSTATTNIILDFEAALNARRMRGENITLVGVLAEGNQRTLEEGQGVSGDQAHPSS